MNDIIGSDSVFVIRSYVLQVYATSGAYSRQHRLLPLLVGLIGVYNFYQVVLTLTG